MRQVKSSKDWSSPVKTGQVNLDEVKLSQESSSQVLACHVKLGLIKSQGGNFFDPKLFGSKTFLNPRIFVDQNFCLVNPILISLDPNFVSFIANHPGQ